MTPREFVEQYGTPGSFVLTLSAGQSITLPFDPDRYLLWFWAGTGTISILPHDSTDIDTVAIATATLPQKFTHALDGSIVNMAFRVTDSGLGSTTIIYVGRMVAPRSHLPEGYPHELSRNTKQKLGTSSGRC